ncbi:MAG: AEC family transporter, partial [Sharpea porci]
MNNLIFSLNATMPVFLLMVFGYFLNRIGWMDDELAAKLNTFVFRIPLPVLLFHQLATTNFIKAWDTKFVLFCFFATFASILIVT